MIVADDLKIPSGNGLTYYVQNLLGPARRAGQRYGYIALFCVCVLLFTGVAFIIGLPGPDANGRDTYNVITRLTRTLTYTLSRTPGQPLLDYMNYVFRSFGGDGAVHGWFVVVSAAGITALYCMLRDLRGVSPVLAALTLALNPLFLTHVGGVGDFAVSCSFLLLSLLFASRRMPIAAGAMLGFAVGCRLVFCTYVIPVSVLVALASRSKGASFRERIRAAATAAGVAALVSTIEYAPSFSFWGRELLHNYPFRGAAYHASAFVFKLFIALGAPIWVIFCGLCVALIWRARKHSFYCTNSSVVIAAVLVVACCLLYFFRVPTKPELTLPVLVGITLWVQFCGGRKWAVTLLIASVSAGVVMLSPLDRETDEYRWHLEQGWYRQNYEEAYQNRFQLQTIRSLLSTLPQNSILIARPRWTIEQSERSDLKILTGVAGVPLSQAWSFSRLGPERIVIDPGESNLRELLDRVTTNSAPGNRMTVVYDKASLGPLRRWSHLDLALYGSSVALRSYRLGQETKTVVAGILN
jgi:hypothetical protein